MNESRYGVAVIGNCATHGEFVAAALRSEPDAAIVGGWEPTPERALGLEKALGAQLASNADELLESPKVDIVAVSCAPADKAYWVEQAAKAGKHIFLNKPMAESLSSARAIAQSVRQHDVHFVHDIPAIRSEPAAAKLLDLVRNEELGSPMHFALSWGMTFSSGFPLAEVWPERLDSPARSGGGELTNMGCYAIDYMVALFGSPKAVIAKSHASWQPYADSHLESFGQIIADYGDFFAVLSAGKQTISTYPELTVAEALDRRRWWNTIELRSDDTNIALHPILDFVVFNGERVETTEWIKDVELRSSFRQLIDAIELGRTPDCDLEASVASVEVLMAAYSSIVQEGARVRLPLVAGQNPLVGA